MSKLIQLDFKKVASTGQESFEFDTTSYQNIDLSDSTNLAKIRMYILPVIAKNVGWDTENLSEERFNADPHQFQNAIDTTIFANVHVLLDDLGNPVGLMEYLEETIENPISRVRMSNLKKLIEDKSAWKYLIDAGVIDQKVLNELLPELRLFFQNKKIYSEIGLVLKPEIQGKGSGYTQMLYDQLKDGILFGWTSNPLIVAQFRKNYKYVSYFPLESSTVKSVEALASVALVYADLLTYKVERWKPYKFGALYSDYFVSTRGPEYLKLVDDLLKVKKISEDDKIRLQYFISQESVQGAIIAMN